MKILTCKQGSTEWSMARAGVITASEADSLFTPKMEPRTGEGVKNYLYRKAAERVMGPPMDQGGTFSMEQGNVVEKIALPWYEFRFGVTVDRVGFCLSNDGKSGCSPDGLIGDLCGLEIKSPQPPTHVKYLLENRVPPEYLPQVHFSMHITGRTEWTFVSYQMHMPQLVVTLMRNDAVQEVIRTTLAAHTATIDDYEARIRAMMPKEGGRA